MRIFLIWLFIYIKFLLKWYAICKYLIKNEKKKNFIVSVTFRNKTGSHSKTNNFQTKLLWELLFYTKLPFKWYIICKIILISTLFSKYPTSSMEVLKMMRGGIFLYGCSSSRWWDYILNGLKDICKFSK